MGKGPGFAWLPPDLLVCALVPWASTALAFQYLVLSPLLEAFARVHPSAQRAEPFRECRPLLSPLRPHLSSY